jgi:hypothetical protein
MLSYFTLHSFSIATMKSILALGLLAASTAALPQTPPPAIGACAELHILVARASGEGKGEGMIGSLSKAVKAAVKGADSEAVDYPAALAPYGSSEIKGVKAAKDQLSAYVKRCPAAKIVLMGYSQVSQL